MPLSSLLFHSIIPFHHSMFTDFFATTHTNFMRLFSFLPTLSAIMLVVLVEIEGIFINFQENICKVDQGDIEKHTGVIPFQKRPVVWLFHRYYSIHHSNSLFHHHSTLRVLQIALHLVSFSFTRRSIPI